MSLSDSVTAAAAVLRRYPADVLPFYLLGTAVPVIVRVIPTLALLVAYAYLTVTGRLKAIQTVLEAGIPNPPDPETEPEAFEAWMQGMEPLISQLFSPALVILILVTLVVSLLVVIVLFPAASAAQIAACYGRLRGERGLLAGFSGARQYWLRFLGIYILEFTLWAAVALIAGIAIALMGGVLGVATGSGLTPALIALPAVIFAAVAFTAIRAVFAFAPAAIVVDDARVFSSLSQAVGFIRHQPIDAAFYYVISVGSLIALSTVTSLLAMINVVSISTLVTTVLLFPFLDLLKTALYGESDGHLSPPSTPDRPLRRQFTSGLRTGWHEMLSFVRATPLLHVFVVIAAVTSFWAGWVAAEPFVGTFETSIATRLRGHVPPAAALELFGNNWIVASTTAYAGLAFAVPALVSLAFNGFVMGLFARLEVEPIELIAFVVPHGIFEIPAILIASALGLQLGAVGTRALLGRATRRDVADALERAFWVVVGIGILLVIAAVIEGFVSPYYYQLIR